MARPFKNTVDYFPHIIKNGKTIFILESKFGNDGYAFWFKLLELLGSSHNHIYDYNNSSDWEFLIAKTKVSEEKANNILKTLADIRAIDSELLKNKIIWCENFVKGIEDVYKRRGQNRPQKPVSDNNNPTPLIVSDNNNMKKSEITIVSDNNNPQTKLKETKLKEIKSKTQYLDCVMLSKEEYEKLKNKYGETLTNGKIEDLNNYIQSKGKEKVYKSHYYTILNWDRKNKKGDYDGKSNQDVRRSKKPGEDKYKHLEETYEV